MAAVEHPGDGAVPEDPAIPALGAMGERGLHAMLGPHGVDGPVSAVRLLKHHPGNRCTVVAVAGGRSVVVKAWATDPTRQMQLYRAFAERGLATGAGPTVSPPIAFDPALRFLVLGWLEGPAIKDLARAGRTTRAAGLAAEWLGITARSGIALGDRYGVDELLQDADRWARFLSRTDPALGSAAAAGVGAMTRSRPSDGPLRLAHGSYSPNHVLDMGSGAGVIDWDGFRQAAPELDPAMLLAKLSRLVTGHEAARLRPQVDHTASEFRGAIADLVDPDVLEWYRAAMLIKLAKYFASRRPKRWLPRAGALLRESREALAGVA